MSDDKELKQLLGETDTARQPQGGWTREPPKAEVSELIAGNVIRVGTRWVRREDVVALEDELAELRKDKARLDWLESNYGYPYQDAVYYDGWAHGRAPYGGWRDAIDLVMEAPTTKEGER